MAAKATLKPGDAEAAVASAAKQLNDWKLPALPNRSRQWAKERPIYIYNVSHKRWVREMGSLGAYTILPCEPGHEYNKPLKLDGIIFETIPVQMLPKKMEYRELDGMDVAQNIIGTAKFLSANDAIDQWGVFISESDPPTYDEIFAAKAKLMAKAHKLVADGDAFYAAGPKDASENISIDHRWALDHTKQNRPWKQQSTLMEECPGCGEAIKPGIAKHTCGAILNPKKALDLNLINKEEFDRLTKKTA
jgi:hypothetical protein